MNEFLNEYFNIKKIIRDKREYRLVEARIKALPEDYRFVFGKIQNYMWSYAAGSGMEMVQILNDLLELFEDGVTEGKEVLAVTGTDVAAFCDELLKSARTYTDKWREDLNQSVMKRVGKRSQ